MAKNVKARVLECLEQGRGEFYSGEQLAGTLAVSRTAVWKAIKELRAEGYAVDAVTNRGYRLLAESDVLSVQGIAPYLQSPSLSERLHILPTAESTNLEAKKLAVQGAPHGTVVIADRQTLGRGRQGRDFFSPPGKGLYLSALLRLPGTTLESATSITTAAAVAVCQSIREVTGVETGIKWVNDVWVGERKVCGILTEAINDFESGAVECVVIGVGINVTTREEEFPPELRKVAASIAPGSADGTLRSRLAAALIRRLSWLDPANSSHMEEYRRRCVVLGKRVSVTQGGLVFSAAARSVNDDGCLLVELDDGSIRCLAGGEVAVRVDERQL